MNINLEKHFLEIEALHHEIDQLVRETTCDDPVELRRQLYIALAETIRNLATTGEFI